METQNISNNLNILSEKLIKNIDDKAYKLIDKILCIDENILKQSPLKELLKADNIEMIQIIGRSLIMIYIIYFIIMQLISIYNGRISENIFSFIIRMIIISAFISCSYFIVEKILNIFGILTELIDKLTVVMINKEATFSNLKNEIMSLEEILKSDILSVDGLIKSMLSFGIINILISFSVRYVKMIFLILISPFSFSLLASNLTKGFFDSWLKLFIINLSTQIFVKFIILIPLSFNDKNNIMFKIILLGTMYMIFKLNDLVSYIMSNITFIRKESLSE